MVSVRRDYEDNEGGWRPFLMAPMFLIAAAVITGLVMVYLTYIAGRIDVPSGHIAEIGRAHV